MGPQYYREAFAVAERFRRPDTNVVHNFQTNGVLINEEWCEFFKLHGITPGVSLDGPASYHDSRRRYRSGKGSHADALRGMRLLRQHAVPFHVIAVVTSASLDAADELFDFFQAEGVVNLAFNVEEIEAANATSSLIAPDASQRFRRFLAQFIKRNHVAGFPLALREFLGAAGAIRHGCPDRHELEPLRILTIDVTGKAYTFSPEFAGTSHEHYGDLSIGSLLTDDLVTLLQSPQLARQFADIRAGVDRCAGTCLYYEWCGGGSPANKLFENGTFDSSETMFCRLARQGVLEETLASIERQLDDRTPSRVA